MQLLGARDENLFRLRAVGIRNAHVDGTDGRTRFVIVKPHALRALLRHDIEDVLCQGGMRHAIQLPGHPALVNGGIRALRLASAAVDALGGDYRGHCPRLPSGQVQSNIRIVFAPRIQRMEIEAASSPASATRPRRTRSPRSQNAACARSTPKRASNAPGDSLPPAASRSRYVGTNAAPCSRYSS